MKKVEFINTKTIIEDNFYCLKNPNHKFELYKYMRDDDKIYFDKEIGNNERLVVRTIHDRYNKKYLEIRYLYYCNNCLNWSNYSKKQSKYLRIPILHFSQIFKSVLKSYT